jgi:hypothetical protein
VSLSHILVQYVADLTTYRGDSSDDIVRDISDPRNGLLLWRPLHTRVVKGELAFLRVRYCSCVTPLYLADPDPFQDS